MPATVRSLLHCALPVVASLGLACGGSASPSPAPLEAPGAPPPPSEAFSADRAWSDLEALTEIGPRAAGSDGAARARAYLVDQLSRLDLEVREIETRDELGEEHEPVELVHVVATIEGRSPGLFLLVTPYDSAHFDEFPFVGANDGASGAALLLELARVLSQRDLPFTTRIVFLEGEGRLGRGGPVIAESRWLGSRALARLMEESDELDRIRLLVAFSKVCDADLHIVRDLGSHRMHREEFWKAARRQGREEAFSREEGFESPAASHVAFRDRGVRPVVAIVDTSFGGDDPPGIYAGSEEDTIEHCAPASLETVGIVSLDAIDAIGARLAKIERFSRSPTADLEFKRSSGRERPPGAAVPHSGPSVDGTAPPSS
jgi:glutaminyl-peptide cyclotransferase